MDASLSSLFILPMENGFMNKLHQPESSGLVGLVKYFFTKIDDTD